MADLGPLPQAQGSTNPIVASAKESVHAAGMMLGFYKPTSSEEAQRLRRRFMADAAALGVGAGVGMVTGGIGGIAPVARAILSSVLSGGASGATGAAIEGGSPVRGGLIGAAVGLPLAFLPGAAGSAARMGPMDELAAAEAAARTATTTAAAPEPPAYGFVRPSGRRGDDVEPLAGFNPEAVPAPQGGGVDYLDDMGGPPTTTTVPAPRGGGVDYLENQPPSVTNVATPPAGGYVDYLNETLPPSSTTVAQAQAGSFVDYGNPPATASHAVGAGTPSVFDTDPTFAGPQWGPNLSAFDVGPAPPGQSARTILGVGGANPTTRKMLEETIKEYREWIKKQLGVRVQGRSPSGMTRGLRRSTAPRPEEITAAEELASIEAGIKGVLDDLPDEPTRWARVLEDIGTIWRRGVRLAGNAINQMGPAGSWLATNMDDVINRVERVASADIHRIKLLGHKITQRDADDVGAALAGVDVVRTPDAARIASSLREQLNEVHAAAKEVGLPELDPRTGKVRPFAYTDNFFPLTYSPKVKSRLLRPGTQENRDAIDRIMAHHLGPNNEREAQELLTRFVNTPPEFAYGPLQQMRIAVLPQFERDFRQVLPRYIANMWKRIEVARTFGPSHQEAAAALKLIRDQGYDHHLASKVYDVFSGKTPRDLNQLVRATRSFNVITLLSTAGVAQFAQHSNTLAFFGFKHFMNGLGALFTKEGKAWAPKTGAYLQELMGEVAPDLGAANRTLGGFLHPGALKQTIVGPNRTTSWLQFIGLSPLDKANRMIAALAGKSWADENAARLVQAAAIGNTKQVEKLGRLFGRIGLKAEDIIKQGGMLTEEQRLIAGQGASHLTQFRGSVLDMPAWARTTVPGQFAYLFKTFSIQQFRFINVLMNEARQGNFAPALRYLGAAGAITPVVGTAIRQLRNRPEPDNPYFGALEAALNAGAIGIASDALKAAANGPEYLLGMITGPTASQLAAFLHEGYQATAEGNPTPLLRDVIRHTPAIGPQLAAWLLPKEER